MKVHEAFSNTHTHPAKVLISLVTLLQSSDHNAGEGFF